MMGKFNQVLTAMAASFGSLMMGILNVWPSYTSDIYRMENNTIFEEPMSESELSLMSSIPSLGAMAGTCIAGPVLERLGRRNGGVLLIMPIVISWSIIMLSSSPIPIFVARFLGGAVGGANLFHAPLFISETAEDSIRGALASAPIFFYCLGALISYLMGWFSSYRFIIWTNLVFGIFGVGLITLAAESPVWLLKIGREEEARKALAHYRGDSAKLISEEVSRIKQSLIPASELIAVKTSEPNEKEDAEKDNLEKADDITEEKTKSQSALRTLFTSPSSRRAFFTLFFIGTTQVFMGIVPVQVYAGSLFKAAAPNLSSSFCSVLLALVLLVGSMVTSGVADKLGRKVLAISSTATVSLTMGALAFLLRNSVAPPWVSAVLLLLYCFCFNFGAGTVPYILLAEAFTPEVQGIASLIFIEWIWFLNFVIIGIFPIGVSLMGVSGTFMIFAVVAAATSVSIWFILPETKGLSNDQIQEAFSRRK